MVKNVSREELSQLEAEWRALSPAGMPQAIFTSPTWLRIWWEEFAGSEKEQLLLAVRNNSRLFGVAPLMREGERISFAGDTEVCDYMDLTAAEGEEDSVVSAMFTALAEGSWNELVFWAIPEFSASLQLIPSAARRLGYRADVELEDVCPRVTLPSSWEEYLQGLSKKDRHELRRKQRRLLAAGDVRLESLQAPAEIAPALDEFFRQHSISRTDKAVFMTERMKSFFRRVVLALAEEGKARLYFLLLNGKPVASIVCFVSEKEILLYNSGYDPDYSHLSVGLLSKAMALEQAILEGKQCFDFLRGAEAYKYDLGARDLKVYRCIVRRD